MDNHLVLPRFFAPHAHGSDEIDLLPEEARHATRVLRLAAGDPLAVFDGRGHEWQARVLSASRTGVTVRLEASIAPAREPRVFVTLLQAVLKGDHMDAVIRDATMMGVGAIRPVVTAHTMASARAAGGAKAVERWRRVAIASAKQCRRAVVPAVEAAQPLPDAIAAAPASDRTPRIVLMEPALGEARPMNAAEVPDAAVLVVGPEGGWSREELARFDRDGFARLTLGALTLRADAAAIVALGVLRERWRDF